MAVCDLNSEISTGLAVAQMLGFIVVFAVGFWVGRISRD